MNGSYALTKAGRHRSGCSCGSCLGEAHRQHIAAEQLYALLNMRWTGIGTAVTYADLARRGIEEAFPQQAQQALGILRERNAPLLDNLLSDILD